MIQPIDFVIPWVDADDLEWQQKKRTFAGDDAPVVVSSNGEERFRDYGTLKYLIRSIEKYANWVHHVYLVTDNQVPTWMDVTKLDDSKFSIVDHRDIFTNQDLPCFNSNAIELNSVNIPNLAEQFVIFNDDLLLNAPTSPEDFFAAGLPKDFRLYTSLKPYSDYDNILFNNSRAINNWLKGKWLSKQGLYHKAYGAQNIKNFYHQRFERGHFVSSYSYPHNAQAFLKTSFKKALALWHDEIEETKANHFRTPNDVSMLLIRDYQLETGQFMVRRPDFSQYHDLNDIDDIEKELTKHLHPLTCINDADTHDYQTVTAKLLAILEQVYPDASSIEKR